MAEFGSYFILLLMTIISVTSDRISYIVGKTTINHPPNHPSIGAINHSQMGRLLLFHSHCSLTIINFLPLEVPNHGFQEIHQSLISRGSPSLGLYNPKLKQRVGSKMSRHHGDDNHQHHPPI